MSSIIEEVKQSYFEYLEKLAAGCQQISDDLRTENTSQAINNIMDAVQGMQWLTEVEIGLNKNNYRINSVMEKANSFLNDINEALEKRDYVYVADLFEYELQPLFEAQLEEKFVKM